MSDDPAKWLTHAHFPGVNATPAVDEDPDDEELPETPEDVISMLGFDPLEIDTPDGSFYDPDVAADAEFKEADHPRAPDGKFGKGSGGPGPELIKAHKDTATALKSEPDQGKKKTAFYKFGTAKKAIAKGDMKALAAIKPFADPKRNFEHKLNDYLQAVKAEYLGGNKIDPDAAPPATPAAKSASASPEHIHNRTEATDAKGNKIVAVLQASTAKIPDDWHAKITDKFNGNHEHGPHAVEPLDPIMNVYAKDVVYKNLSKDEKENLGHYQNGSHREINRAVAGMMPKSTSEYTMYAPMVKSVKKAVQSAVIPADMPVWRGIGAPLADIIGTKIDPEKAVGTAFVHKSFASVSRNRDKSTLFANGKTLMKFTVPAGSKGLVMQNQGYEREILLDSHAMFRIDKIEKDVHGVQHVLHCTYLGHQEGT